MRNSFEGGEIPKLTDSGLDNIMEGAKEVNDSEKDLEELDDFIVQIHTGSLDEPIMLQSKLFEKSDGRSAELKKKSISEAQSLHELYAIIALGDDIEMAGQSFPPKEVIKTIKEIVRGEAEVKNITRNNGLRDKVIELLNM